MTISGTLITQDTCAPSKRLIVAGELCHQNARATLAHDGRLRGWVRAKRV